MLVALSESWSDPLPVTVVSSAAVVLSISDEIGSSADDELVFMTEPSAKPAVMTITPSAAPMRSRFLSTL